MISFFRKLLHLQFGPSVAHLHQQQWDSERRVRQAQPFIVDPLSVFPR